MAVYVRKLAHKRNIDNILNSDTIEDIYADSISAEFRTKDNRLSIWEAPDENIDLGVLAIALSSSKIDTMDFIILTDEIIRESGLTIKKTKPSENPLIKAYNMHYDISDLCLRDFTRLAVAYKTAGADGTRIKRYSKAQLKEKIGQAKKDGLVDGANANDEVKKTIDAL